MGTKGKVTAVRVRSCGSLGLWYRGEHGSLSKDSPKQDGQGENPGRILTFIPRTAQGTVGGSGESLESAQGLVFTLTSVFTTLHWSGVV